MSFPPTTRPTQASTQRRLANSINKGNARCGTVDRLDLKMTNTAACFDVSFCGTTKNPQQLIWVLTGIVEAKRFAPFDRAKNEAFGERCDVNYPKCGAGLAPDPDCLT